METSVAIESVVNIVDGIQDDEVDKMILYGAKNVHELKE